MTRRSKATGKASTSQRRKGAAPKPRNAIVERNRRRTSKQTELVRLTRERDEALEQLSGASEVLNVINSSSRDLQAVFAAILTNALRICQAKFGTLYRFDGEKLHFVAEAGAPRALAEFYKQRAPFLPPPGNPIEQAILTKRPSQVADYTAAAVQGPAARFAGAGSTVWIPMLAGDLVIGVILVYRREVRLFTDRQIALLQNFAAQAVIAIENARLFNEVQARTRDLEESLQQQTATSEVLNVISRSLGELEPVFQSMLENATRVCGASFGSMNLYHGGEYRTVAFHNSPAAFLVAREMGFRPHPESTLGRVAATKHFVHYHDLRKNPAYLDGDPAVVAMADIAGARTILVVPMLKDDELIGAITIYRQEVQPFNDKQVALLSNFANQVLIAIENARLLRELRERTTDLTKSLDDLRTAQDRLVQTEKLASLGQLTAGIAHEIKNPLNFVNNFSALSAELVDEMTEVFENPALDEARRRKELDDIRELLKGNLEKIVAHGKRADSIVKNMLLHSREGSGEQRTADINAIVEDSLNLAYHGARAEKSGFAITLRPDLAPDAGAVELYPQEITRALLNVISNGFYAATRRKAESGDDSFEPMLSASTRNLGTTVEIRIRDNGAGIPPDVREKMFVPFFTTKPTGEGTGLGLSMTHDIVVKQHGGRIDVETEPGAFTEFIITLPRGNSTAARPKPE